MCKFLERYSFLQRCWLCWIACVPVYISTFMLILKLPMEFSMFKTRVHEVYKSGKRSSGKARGIFNREILNMAMKLLNNA